MKYIMVIMILFFGVICAMEEDSIVLFTDSIKELNKNKIRNKVDVDNQESNMQKNKKNTKKKNCWQLPQSEFAGSSIDTVNNQNSSEDLNEQLLRVLQDGCVDSLQGYVLVQDFVYNKQWLKGYYYGESDQEDEKYGDTKQGQKILEGNRSDEVNDFVLGYNFGYTPNNDLDKYLLHKLNEAQEAKLIQVKRLLAKKANPNYSKVDSDNNVINTPLIAAMRTIAYPQVINLLIESGADPNVGVIRNKDHDTPLIQFAELIQCMACCSTTIGSFDKLYWESNYLQQVFDKLLKKGADVNYQGNFGQTFAHRMLEDMTYPRVGNFFAQNVLSNDALCKKINWSLQDDFGVIIFDYIPKINISAIAPGRKGAIKKLILNKQVQTIFLQRLFGATKSAQCQKQLQDLHNRICDDNCVDFDWQDYKGDTLLHHFMRAIPCSSEGFDPKGKNKFLKQTLALTFWNSDYVAALKKTIKESDLSKVNKSGKTPLSVAIQEKNLFGVLYLMFYGAQYKDNADDICQLFNYYAKMREQDYAFLRCIDLKKTTHEDLKLNLIKNMPQHFFEEQCLSSEVDKSRSLWNSLMLWGETPRPVEEANKYKKKINNILESSDDDENLVVIEKTGDKDLLEKEVLKFPGNPGDNHDHFQDSSELPEPQFNLFLRFVRNVRNIPSYTIRAFFPAKKEEFQQHRTLKGFFVAFATAPFICCKVVVASCYDKIIEKICNGFKI